MHHLSVSYLSRHDPMLHYSLAYASGYIPGCVARHRRQLRIRALLALGILACVARRDIACDPRAYHARSYESRRFVVPHVRGVRRASHELACEFKLEAIRLAGGVRSSSEVVVVEREEH